MTRFMLQIAMLVGVMTVGLGFTTDVHAACGGAICTGRVNRLYTQSLGPTNVYVDTDGIERNLSCTAVAGVYLILSPSQPLFSQVYESLLKAVTFGKPVQIRLPASGPCQIQYVVLERGSTISGSAREGFSEAEEE